MRRVRFISVSERSKGEGKVEEGKEERKLEVKLWAETDKKKIANAPARNRTRDPSKRGRCSTIEPPRQATSPVSLFKILSALPPLHNIGISQCPQLTNPLRSGDLSRSFLNAYQSTIGTDCDPFLWRWTNPLVIGHDCCELARRSAWKSASIMGQPPTGLSLTGGLRNFSFLPFFSLMFWPLPDQKSLLWIIERDRNLSFGLYRYNRQKRPG